MRPVVRPCEVRQRQLFIGEKWVDSGEGGPFVSQFDLEQPTEPSAGGRVFNGAASRGRTSGWLTGTRRRRVMSTWPRTSELILQR